MPKPHNTTVPACVITGTSLNAGQRDWFERGTSFWDIPAEQWPATGTCYSTDPAATNVAVCRAALPDDERFEEPS